MDSYEPNALESVEVLKSFAPKHTIQDIKQIRYNGVSNLIDHTYIQSYQTCVISAVNGTCDAYVVTDTPYMCIHVHMSACNTSPDTSNIYSSEWTSILKMNAIFIFQTYTKFLGIAGACTIHLAWISMCLGKIYTCMYMYM